MEVEGGLLMSFFADNDSCGDCVFSRKDKDGDLVCVCSRMTEELNDEMIEFAMFRNCRLKELVKS